MNSFEIKMLVDKKHRNIVFLLFLSSLLIGFPKSLTVAVSQTLFISKVGADHLPEVYILSAFFTALAGFLLLRIQKKLDFHKYTHFVLNFLIAGIFSTRLLLEIEDSKIPFYFAAVWYEMEWIVSSFLFGSLLNYYLNIQQAKKYFGLISSGEIIIIISGGLLTPILIDALALENLLLISLSASLILHFVLFRLKTFSFQAGEKKSANAQNTLNPKQKFSNYEKVLFMIASSAAFCFLIIDNNFYYYTSQNSSDLNQTASFIARFFAGCSILVLICRALFVAKFFERFGFLNGILALPLFLSLLLVGFLFKLVPNPEISILFILFCSLKALDKVMRDSLFKSAILFAHQPLEEKRRLSTLTWTETIIEPVASILVAVLMISFFSLDAEEWELRTLSLIPFLFITAYFALKLSGDYKKQLLKALSKKSNNDFKLNLKDPAVLHYLEKILKKPRTTKEALYAFSLIEKENIRSVVRNIKLLCQHKMHEVRNKAIDIIEKQKVSVFIPELIEKEEHPIILIKLFKLAFKKTYEGAEQDYLLNLFEYKMKTLSFSSSEKAKFISCLSLIDSPKFQSLKLNYYKQIKSKVQDKPSDFLRLELELGKRPDFAIINSLSSKQISQNEVRETLIKQVFRGGYLEDINGLIPKISLKGMSGKIKKIIAEKPDCAKFVAEYCLTGKDERYKKAYILESIKNLNLSLEDELLIHAFKTSEFDKKLIIINFLYNSNFKANNALKEEIISLIESLIEVYNLIIDIELEKHMDLYQKACHELHRKLNMTLLKAFVIIDIFHDEAALIIRSENISDANLSYLLEILNLSKEIDKNLRLSLFRFFINEHKNLKLKQKSYSKIESLFNLPKPCLLKELNWCMTLIISEKSADYAYLPLAQEPEQNMLETIEKVIVLRNVSMFEKLTDSMLYDLSTIVKEQEFKKADIVIKEGEIGAKLFIIVSGEVEVLKNGKTIANLKENDVFGELSLLDPEPRSANVICNLDSKFFVIDKDDFYDILERDRLVLESIIHFLCQRLRGSLRQD